MVQIVGKYQHERNENLDGYFRAIGVPYIPRKMMAMSNPLLEVICENDIWIITSTTLLRTHKVTFTLGEEYDEIMPSGDILKCVTTLQDNLLITQTKAPNGSKATRTYSFSDEGLILTMFHEESGETAKRYFRRLI